MQIIIKNLKIKTRLGVYDYEKLNSREILVSLVIDYNATQAIKTDTLSDTIDYDKIVEIVSCAANMKHFNLLETLSTNIIDRLVNNFPLVKSIEIKIHKPGVVPNADRLFIKDFFIKE